jgi:hypothetical protein
LVPSSEIKPKPLTSLKNLTVPLFIIKNCNDINKLIRCKGTTIV